MAIKGVTFDWWGTVVEIPAVRDIYDETMREIRVDRAAEALKAAGFPVSRRLLRRAYDAQTDLLLQTWNDLRDLSVEEQTRAYLGLLGVGEGREDLIRALQDAFGSAIEARLPALYPDIGETLRALRDRGYHTGLISNTGRTGGRFLRPVQDRL
ncbi:MAG: HAD family hydrolase, partial [Methanobacteriota archaeon]